MINSRKAAPRHIVKFYVFATELIQCSGKGVWHSSVLSIISSKEMVLPIVLHFALECIYLFCEVCQVFEIILGLIFFNHISNINDSCINKKIHYSKLIKNNVHFIIQRNMRNAWFLIFFCNINMFWRLVYVMVPDIRWS